MKNFYETVLKTLKDDVEKSYSGNVSAASRAYSLSDSSTLNHWLSKRRSPSLQAIGPIMDKMGVQVIPPSEEAIDYEYIPMVEAVAGAGSSFETSGDIQGYLAFRKDYCTRRRIHANTCITLTVSGDSMTPLLQSGDTILVDTSEKDVRSGSIYLIGLGEECLVKQLNRTPSGISVHSINPIYPDTIVPAEQVGEYLCVHGRVKWYGRDLD